MTADGTATLPSLLCDGAATARPVGPVRFITPAVEGAYAFVVVGGDGYAPGVWRWHLAAAGLDGIFTLADPVGAARVVGSTWGDVRGSIAFTPAGDCVRFLSSVWTPPTYRLSRVAARWCDLTLRGPVEESSRPIEPWGKLLPVEDDDVLGVQVRDGALEVAELRDEARVRRVPVGEGAERVLASAGGAAVVDVVTRRDGRIDGHRLVVVGMHDEVLRGAVKLTRRPLLAALSPDATRLAVAYVDGGVEVFGVPARAAER